MADINDSIIGFGGGCHWCTEAVFQSIIGVETVQQGFIKSRPPYEQYSEAVLIEYDPDKIDVAILIDIHLRTHASMSAHKMRGKYRSAIYNTDDDDTDYRIILDVLQQEFDQDLVTQILPIEDFKLSDERFQNYYKKGPEKPFCKNYIDPKLSLLWRKYTKNYKDNA